MKWKITLDKINAAIGDMADYAEVNGQIIVKWLSLAVFLWYNTPSNYFAYCYVLFGHLYFNIIV